MLRFTIRQLLGIPALLTARREFASRSLRVPTGAPVLNYGSVRNLGGLIAGGRVKLTHLAERWPESDPFNVLYLVSSAPPPFARELVLWAKKRGARFVWNQNGVGFPAWAGVRAWETNLPMRRLLRLADHVVYQSHFCRESADRWLEPASCRSSVLINPVDTAFFKPVPSPLDSWKLLAAGTHYQPFRVIGALETLRVLLDAGHRATLTVAGELRWQNAEAEVHDAVTRLRLAEWVTMRPAFTQDEAVRLYQESHVLLHLKYHDPCPTVAIEALACGIPVVSSASGGMPEIVGADGGEMLDVTCDWFRADYPPARAIAAAVARVMREWPRRSEAARTRAERLFRKQDWVDAHSRIFEGLLN